MTATIVVLVVALVATSWLALRERATRRTAEARVRAAEAQGTEDVGIRASVVPVAAHELRSPISVILGYQELLADGMYGQLDERGSEALTRIRRSAEQLLRLVDGIVELAGPASTSTAELEPVDLADALAEALESATAYGQAYAVQLETRIEGELPRVTIDRDRVIRALDMALAAAVKASPGRTLAVTATPVPHGLTMRITGTGLDPERDDAATPGRDLPLIRTGAGLRLAIARRALQPVGGDVVLHRDADGVTLELRVTGAPAVSIDGGGEAR